MFFFLALSVMLSGARYYFHLKDITPWRALNTPSIGFNLIVTIVTILTTVTHRWGENSTIFDFFRFAR